MFEVEIYFSGFCTYQVEAENGDKAIQKARKLGIDENEILTTLENWKEADSAREMDLPLTWDKLQICPNSTIQMTP